MPASAVHCAPPFVSDHQVLLAGDAQAVLEPMAPGSTGIARVSSMPVQPYQAEYCLLGVHLCACRYVACRCYRHDPGLGLNPGQNACATWPVRGQDTYSGPWNARTSPILVIGHTAFLNPSTCASNYMTGYFQTGALPQKGTVCHQNLPPFPPPSRVTQPEPRRVRLRHADWRQASRALTPRAVKAAVARGFPRAREMASMGGAAQ